MGTETVTVSESFSFDMTKIIRQIEKTALLICTAYNIYTTYWNRQVRANSVDPDQTLQHYENTPIQIY